MPGLLTAVNTAGSLQLERIRQLHQTLPNDDDLDQELEELFEEHLPHLFQIIHGYKALHRIGFHLIHRHFNLPIGKVLLGSDDDQPHVRYRMKPTAIEDLRGKEIHGHIYTVNDSGSFEAYELSAGPGPDIPLDVLAKLEEDLISYMRHYNLHHLLGPQILPEHIDKNLTMEIFAGEESLMVDGSKAEELGYKPGRTTGWVGELQHDGTIRSRGVQVHALVQGEKKCYINAQTVDGLQALLI